MIRTNRRGFLCAAALSGVRIAAGQTKDDAQASRDVTRTLARYVVQRPRGRSARRRAQGGVADGVELGGLRGGASRHETVDIAICGAGAVLRAAPRRLCSAAPSALDIFLAALVNGISSHVFDFDDTHLKTIIHPAGPVASAILALAEHQPVSGEEFLQCAGAGRGGGVPDRQRGLSGALRRRLAHHRHRRAVRRRRCGGQTARS